MEIIEAWHIWLALGIALIALETIAPGFVLGSFAIGAFITVIPAYFDVSLNMQIIIFSIFSIISFLLLRPMVLRYLNRGEDVKLNGDNLVGKMGVVTKDFDHLLNKGRVRVGGDDWVAINVGKDNLFVNDVVSVEAIDSITLHVKKKPNELAD